MRSASIIAVAISSADHAASLAISFSTAVAATFRDSGAAADYSAKTADSYPKS